MNPALSQLFWLKMRGGFRHRLRQLASVRGVCFLVLMCAILWMLVRAGSASGSALSGGSPRLGPEEMRQYIDIFMPLGLLGATLFTVLVSSGPAIYFSSNEINFLFTGPFSRRDLVIFKIATYFAGAIMSAAIITLLIPPRASTGLAAFAGTLLTLLFIQLGSAAVRIGILSIEGDWFASVRRAGLAALGGAGVALLLYLSVSEDVNLVAAMSVVRHSWPGTVVLAPFAVFARIFMAEAVFPGLVLWIAVAVAINMTLLMLVLALDERTSDRALAENRRLNERWARIKEGGSFLASGETTSRSMRRAPVAGGLGPIVWRQAINAVRNSGRVVLVFLAIGLLTGPIIKVAGLQVSSSSALGGIYFLVAFMMPRSLACDFRGEISRMEQYKSLPLAPWQICVAQLVVPVVLASLILLGMIASLIVYADFTTVVILGVLAFFVVPVSVLLYGLENLVFLLFPTKLVPVGRVDFDFLGRTLVDFMGKSIVIITVLGTARAVGMRVQDASDGSFLALAGTSWIIVAVCGLATIPLMTLAFRRFRISETIE